jgi:pyridoxamine 5'-phosphate oxidase
MNKNMDLSYLRAQYNNDRLKEPLDDQPWGLMRQWFQEAISNEAVMEPNAMSLATSTADGHPSVRLVLAKEIIDGGVVFFTNYKSQKGRVIVENPNVAATIWWPEM